MKRDKKQRVPNGGEIRIEVVKSVWQMTCSFERISSCQTFELARAGKVKLAPAKAIPFLGNLGSGWGRVFFNIFARNRLDIDSEELGMLRLWGRLEPLAKRPYYETIKEREELIARKGGGIGLRPET